MPILLASMPIFGSPCLYGSCSYDIRKRAYISIGAESVKWQSVKEDEAVSLTSGNVALRVDRSSAVTIACHRRPPGPEGFSRCRGDEGMHALDHCGAGSLGVPGPRQTARKSCLVGRVVAFTTPLQYANRFEALLRDEGAEPLWCPTIVTQQSEQTRREVELHVGQSHLSEFKADGIAFTSRAGIKAFADVLNGRQLPLHSDRPHGGLEHECPPFFVASLGKDAELLQELNIVADNPRVAMVVPAISTPQALVEALGEGRGRKLLCPVPLVEGLEEPPVVPQFLKELRKRGWDAVRVNSYATRWLGCDCVKPLLVDDSTARKAQFVPMDALVVTSTAEIEGLLKSLASLGYDGVQALQRGTRKFLVAAHGPVTALGAERLGVEVDVVGKEFQSFAGVIKALEAKFANS